MSAGDLVCATLSATRAPGIGAASIPARQALCARLPAHYFVDSFCELLKFLLCRGAGRVLAHRETAHYGFGHYDPLPDPRQHLLSQLLQRRGQAAAEVR